MTERTDWRPLLGELDRWAAEGRQARFWLRDDDAVDPTPALDRLLALTGGGAIPLTLAVIPARTGPDLAARLDGAAQVGVALHGWSHENHAGPGEKSQELGPHRPAAVVLTQLKVGRERLAELHGARFLPLLVPPWNRIDPALVPRLGEAGLSALSVFGPEQDGPMPQANCHVDLIDWRGTRGGREGVVLVAEIVARLRDGGGVAGSVGILGHHLVHDEPAWTFLAELVERTAGHPACRWTSVTEVLAAGAHTGPAG